MLVATSHAATIRGRVVDEHGAPVAHAVVAFGTSGFAEADDKGAYALDVADDAKGNVWVRVPEGFAPGAVWKPWPSKGPVDLVVRHAIVKGPIVVASDAHLGIPSNTASDLATAIDQIGDPALFAILGDVTQGGTDAEFDQVGAALSRLGDVPWIPVPGNHDWYDNGVAWAQRIGPDNYSFDALGVHFVVWNMALDEPAVVEFLRGDLERVHTPVIGMTHAPPSERMIASLAKLHVAYVLTGHAHSNRVVHHDGVTEYNTEPFLMGGLDFTPAGYRVIAIDHGALTSQHRVTVERPVLSILTPRCATQILVASDAPSVRAQLDDTSVSLTAVGGWDWRGTLPPLTPGPHRLVVDAAGTHASSTIERCTLPAPRTGAAWPQVGGNPAHTGTAAALSTELAQHWITPVGGHILSASPAIANGLVYVTVTDLGDGNAGGIVALDLATGTERWRAVTPVQVRGGVAVVNNVVVAPRIDGTVVGFDAALGTTLWVHELRPGTVSEAKALFASVAADDDDALIGHQRAFAVLDAHDGDVRWDTDPAPDGADSQSLSAVAIGENRVVGTFNRIWGGVQAWDRTTGRPLWKLETSDTIGINASPVIANHVVYVVDAATQVTAIDLAYGWVNWRAQLDPDGFEWGNATIATPAIANNVLVVPTLYRDVVALDATTGAELWRHSALPSPIRTTHYRGAHEAGYESSPIITGDLVWIADTSGELAALDLKTGKPKFRATVGAPVLAGLAASGDWLVVASFDGTVHGFAPAPPIVHAPRSNGCSSTTPSWLVLLVVLGFIRSRRC